MTRSPDPDVRLLASLADPARLEILRELAGSSEVCACDLTECCQVSQPTVSHHLRVLREAGAVVSERRGSNIYYRISPDLIERLGSIARGLVPGGLVAPESLTTDHRDRAIRPTPVARPGAALTSASWRTW